MKKTRKDCFFGVHFDFHAMPQETVARYFCPDVLCEMLDRVKPDFLQVDTKGHPGISSYPTKKGTPAFSINADLLSFWREETQKRGILLYGHHSGLYDMEVALNHPDWAVADKDGNISDSYLSVFSPYIEKILIPQLKELALDYRLDGAWIDGECWGAHVDYSENAKNAFYEKHGIKAEDADEEFYREFIRDGFRNYVRSYVEAVKAVRPDFEITSNWIYSPYMPEKKTVEVDFLSGDYACNNAVVSGRLSGRYLAARNMTWDLMSWGQNAVPCSWQTHNRSTKEENQYKQEAAEIIALGGGYQFFNIAYCGGGYVQRWAIPLWERVAEFCRQRQFCHGARPYSPIAVMVPYETTSLEMSNLYTTWSKPSLSSFNTWVNALCDIQLSPNVIFESELTDLSEYELIIIPDRSTLTSECIKRIEAFVKGGGTVICDLLSVNNFSSFTGISAKNISRKLRYVSSKDSLSAFEAFTCDVLAEKGFGELYTENYFENDSICEPSAYFKEIGSGRFFGLSFDFSQAYASNVSSAFKKWLSGLIDQTGVHIPVKVKGSGYVEVVSARKNDDLLISLINLTGDHRRADVRSFNEIVPLHDLRLEIDKPCVLREMPKNQLLDSRDGIIEKLEIMTTVIAENYFK